MVKAISEEIDFHDSSLIEIAISGDLNTATLTVYAPFAGRSYAIILEGVLRFEFETTGSGKTQFPISLYDIYLVQEDEYQRWSRRLRVLESRDLVQNDATWSADTVDMVHHVMFASSSVRGIGDREELEGISVVCRHLQIVDVSNRYPDSQRFPFGGTEGID